MKLYLLSCENILEYAERILPRLPERRRLAFERSRSPQALGAGLLLSSLLGVKSDSDLVYGPQGMPSLAAGQPAFSLSHSYQRVLLGVSDGPVGVDLEKRDRIVTEAMIRRICLPQERGVDPLTVFTRKECAMKLTGLGFSLPLSKIDTTADFHWEGQPYRFFTDEAEGYVLSALSAEEPPFALQRLRLKELL